uniref:Uncharacterized protein n=1 Tax=Heliothis virescens TaxID=7102 RepID=A0A2A4J9X5_HELVI
MADRGVFRVATEPHRALREKKPSHPKTLKTDQILHILVCSDCSNIGIPRECVELSIFLVFPSQYCVVQTTPAGNRVVCPHHLPWKSEDSLAWITKSDVKGPPRQDRFVTY